MIILSKEGNLFNVEAAIQFENDPGELAMLSQALLDHIQKLEAALKPFADMIDENHNIVCDGTTFAIPSKMQLIVDAQVALTPPDTVNLPTCDPSFFIIGEKYNYRNQPERLIYRGYNFSGNGHWHQFAKVEDPGVIWHECLDPELKMIEKTNDNPRQLVRGNVIRNTSLGQFIIIRKAREIHINEEFVSDRAHEDGDFSYMCGSDYCRCSS